MVKRVMVSDKTYTYLSLIRIYYYPEKSALDMLDYIVEQFEQDYGLKEKLLESS